MQVCDCPKFPLTLLNTLTNKKPLIQFKDLVFHMSILLLFADRYFKLFPQIKVKKGCTPLDNVKNLLVIFISEVKSVDRHSYYDLQSWAVGDARDRNEVPSQGSWTFHESKVRSSVTGRSLELLSDSFWKTCQFVQLVGKWYHIYLKQNKMRQQTSPTELTNSHTASVVKIQLTCTSF